MKKPALIETTVRSFPDKDFDAATTRTTIEGYITGTSFHCPLKGRESLLNRIRKDGLGPHPHSVSKPWKKRVRDLKQTRFSDP